LKRSQSVERTAREIRLALSVVLCVLASCDEAKESPQTSPSAPPRIKRGYECPDDSVAKCVARYSKPELSPADIAKFDRGCMPPEVPLPKFNYSREPGGPMELASRLPCDPSKIMFEDGTIITERRGPR
jgi:hypothetical protein